MAQGRHPAERSSLSIESSVVWNRRRTAFIASPAEPSDALILPRHLAATKKRIAVGYFVFVPTVDSISDEKHAAAE
jgi:hypothetical protein